MLKPYILTVEDTVTQVRDYVVFAKDDEDAKVRVSRGEFVNESEATTVDTLSSEVKSIMELKTTDNDELRAAVIVKKREVN